ncbi:hypothetical protein HY485_05175 [Candidatus Woesearchaeota archaeon]|nr:hypothetical protein [Candidatus Woesearchaeota archaeon]
MPNNLQKYNPQQEFAVERVYQKLTRGIEGLSGEEAVDALLNGTSYLRQGINQVIDRLFVEAEGRHFLVLKDRSQEWTQATERVRQAMEKVAAAGSYDDFEKCLRDATKATIQMKESASKMKFIKHRGQTAYDPARELIAFARELEEHAKKNYGVKLLEGGILR